MIVSAGALQSPVVLMRSGIGPGAHLAEHGIAVQVDRPGVGENLQEHPNIGISGYLHPSARLPSREVHHLQALLRYSSNIDGIPPGDMHVAIAARGGWHAVGQRIGTLGFWVNKSYSTGRVRLSSSPDKRSDIDFRMLSDPRDMARLKQAFRIGVRAMTAAKRAGVVLDVFPSGYSPRIRELTRPEHAQCGDHRCGGAADGPQRRYPPEDHDLCGRHRTFRRGACRRRRDCWRRICAGASTAPGIRAGRAAWAIRRTAWR